MGGLPEGDLPTLPRALHAKRARSWGRSSRKRCGSAPTCGSIAVLLDEAWPFPLRLDDVSVEVGVELLAVLMAKVEIKLAIPDLPGADVHRGERLDRDAIGAVSPVL